MWWLLFFGITLRQRIPITLSLHKSVERFWELPQPIRLVGGGKDAQIRMSNDWSFYFFELPKVVGVTNVTNDDYTETVIAQAYECDRHR